MAERSSYIWHTPRFRPARERLLVGPGLPAHSVHHARARARNRTRSSDIQHFDYDYAHEYRFAEHDFQNCRAKPVRPMNDPALGRCPVILVCQGARPSRRPLGRRGLLRVKGDLHFKTIDRSVRPEEPPSLWRRLEGRAFHNLPTAGHSPSLVTRGTYPRAGATRFRQVTS